MIRNMMKIDFGRVSIFFILAGIIGIFLYTVYSHFSYTPDDTYIYLQFARNVINGSGVSFNPNEPTYGITSPLWLILVSGAGAAGMEPYQAAKWLDILFASSALAIFYLLSLRVIQDKGISIIAVMVFSVNGWFVRWSGTGMETSLAVFLLLLVFLFALGKRYYLAISFAALLTLTRPEGCLMALIILWAILRSGEIKNKRSLITALLGVFGLILAPWLLFAAANFGTVIPNTMGGKVGLSFSAGEIYATTIDAIRTLGVTDGLIILFILLYVILCFKRRSLPGVISLFKVDFYFFAWSGMIFAFYILSDTNVVSRYLLLIIPLVIIYGYRFMALFLKAVMRESFLYAGIFILTASIMIQNQIFYHRIVRPGIEAFSFGMENCLIPIGKWLNRNTEKSATLLVSDIGAIGYYSERKIYDAAGLVSPEFHPLLNKGLLPQTIIESGDYPPGCRPDFIIHRGDRPGALGNEVSAVALLTKPFYRLSLSDDKVAYYTVYKFRTINHNNNLEVK